MRVKLGTLCVAVTVVMAQEPPAKPPVRRALVVSNSKYASLPELPASSLEADRVADALADAKFEVTRVKDFAQKDFFGNKEKSFLETIQPGDTCLFYYSGYAVQVPGEDSYLLPVDFSPNDPSEMDARAILLSRLPEDFQEHKADLKIIVVEAQRRLDTMIAGTTAGLTNPSLSDLNQTLFAFAAQPGKTTAPPPADGIGWFTSSLVKQMKLPGVPLKDVFEATKKEVGAQTGGEQVPFENDNVFQEFLFHEKLPEPVITNVIRPGVPFPNRQDRQQYVWIPPGHFNMGCVPDDVKCEKDENPRHPVTLTKGFWMGQTEVTVNAYRRFVDDRKLKMPTAPVYGFKSTDQPIVDVAWDQAMDFCKWAGGRLPTEAEWEYAARGEVDGEINGLGDNAREKANFDGKKGNDKFDVVAPVKQFDPNKFMLYDMLGNVWEWVNDWYDESYYAVVAKDPMATDPAGPAMGKEHVIRGGSFDSLAEKHLRLSIRRPNGKGVNNVGMRCVLDESPATEKLLGR